MRWVPGIPTFLTPPFLREAWNSSSTFLDEPSSSHFFFDIGDSCWLVLCCWLGSDCSNRWNRKKNKHVNEKIKLKWGAQQRFQKYSALFQNSETVASTVEFHEYTLIMRNYYLEVLVWLMRKDDIILCLLCRNLTPLKGIHMIDIMLYTKLNTFTFSWHGFSRISIMPMRHCICCELCKSN